MGRRGDTFWRLAARAFFVPLFAWLLAAQSILLPLAKAQAAERAGASGVLAILCASTLPVPGEAGDELPPKMVQDCGCCTLAGRLDLDAPVAALLAPIPLVVPDLVGEPVTYILPHGRGPPADTSTPSAARAPPSSI